MNVTDPIRRFARIHPGASAVIRADHSKVSFQDFDRLIDAAARYLAGQGLGPGQTVGIVMGGTDEFHGLTIALALARLGVASAHPTLAAERMALFITEGRAPEKPGVRNLAIEAIWAGIMGQGPDGAAVRAHPDGSAVYRYFGSSGTTGAPKLSAVTHDMLTRRVMDNWRNVGGTQAAHICALGLGIEYGATHLLRTLWSGGAMVLTNPTQLAASIRWHNVTSIAISATSLRQVVAALPDGATPPPSLLAIEVGGSPLPAPLRALVQQKLCANILSHYGSTETGAVASAPFAVLGDALGVVGYVHSGVEVQAVDAGDQALPPGTEGILRGRAPNAITCYFADPATSAKVFKDGWFYSGDIGAVSEDGLLTITGRTGDFINAGGNKIAPAVIEEALLSIPQVTDAAAFGVPDSMGIIQIWAAIVGRTRIDNALLNKVCFEKLFDKAPKYVVQLKALPRNQNGKLLREELVKFAISQQASG